ncbi:Transient receptor potential cation channel like protein [Argiope bruennichi]|uniref:Transient receptor potential cation channel like protein n=1 Tax=Argiope bruennichi TaxID=94029 RepID=A0A8T0FBM4_ARGBR|nr:Transient receptor potential cation channel like protein [Argiope bruennichi]
MSSKVYPQPNRGRKQSVISSLIRGITGSKCQVSPSKQNGAVTEDTEVKRSNSDLLSVSSNDEPVKPSGNKGEIFFWRNFGYDQEGRPYLKVNHDANMEDTGHILQEWKLGTPRIVLVVMSNVAPLSQWTNTRQIKNFQKGLISATNTTDMWILTNGINVGVTKIIGDAVHEEINRRNSKNHFQKNHQSDPNSRIVVIGVARQDLLNHGDNFDGSNQRVEIENEGNKIEEQKFDLNPDHTHFLIVKDGTINKTGINYFLLRLQHYLASSLEQPRKSASTYRLNRCALGILEIPVVAVLFQGGTDCARLVLDHLKRHLPLVVMKGTGGLADILGFAYSEINQRPQGIADAEFCENYLKPELSRKISEKFPKLRDNSLSRNIFRDRIIDCIRYAKQNEQIYLTVLNIYEHNCNLENLGNHLLRSLFKSQVIDNTNWHAQMHKDLYLTLDWNSPHVAMSEVFMKDPSNKFKIDKDFFDEAILRPQRESFVDLFLNQGFQVHKYLTPRRLILLFRKVRHQEFFQTVCWEGAMGYGPMNEIKRNFIETDLNWLIEKITSLENFVSSQELSLNAMGMYTSDPSAAERKAKVLLTFWAIFTNRIVLAKTLWKHADQPIHLALVLSMMIERLSLYVNDTSLKAEMEESSGEFADIATSMLDACYLDTPDRAFDVLNEESPGWAYNTAVDIAAEAQNKRFLSHICCQKWLTNEFFGKIKIRELSWGVFTVPISIKVLLCAFLIFPMYAWTIFQTKECISTEEDKDMVDFESETESDDKNLIKEPPPEKILKKWSVQRTWNVVKWNPSTFRRYVIHHPPLWKMIYLMWSAPITKFWTFQMFYIVYLAFFSIAVLWPSCGNYILDIIVCCWTSLLALESVHPAVRMRKKYKAKAFVLKILEIIVMFVFVILYIVGRLLPVTLIDPYSTRVILCLGLIYFYYRIIYIYLPISPTLGPLLYRVKLMVLVDFINFMRMTILVIISGGIVIHAVMYPDYPFNKELFRRTFHKAWFSLFLTPITDLSGEVRCNSLIYSKTSNASVCRAGEYEDWKCPSVGLWAYIFNIQYFVLLKLILLTLLYALFSATASKLSAESDAIWKFQRYHLVVDFSNRLRLPAPLNIISYLIILVQISKWLIYHIFCCTCKNRNLPEDLKSDGRRFSIKDYTYWNQLAQEYDASQQTKEMEQGILEKQMDMIRSLMEDFVYHKQMMQSLKSSVRELERLMNYSHVHLENIRHLANRETSVFSAWDSMGDPGNRSLPPVMNILSRRSPYPGTRVQRFPVPDKYVPWEVMWISYDPVAFTQQRPDFPVNLQSHVDEDILLLREKNGPQQALPVYAWNSVSVNPAGIGLDRQSWITVSDGSALVYKLDSEGVPQNPMGRTGLRGRGSLPRWGPNHYVHAIITRFQKAREAFLATKGLEFVVLWTDRRFQLSIPGGFVAGEHRYEVIQSMFKNQFVGNAVWMDSNSVTKFFRDCVVTKSELSESTESFPNISENEEILKPMCEIVHKGYMDDPSNTDQAWKEVELWHVHFDMPENVSEKLQTSMGWRLITEDAFFKLPAGQAVLLQDIARKMKATIL